jgi:D-aminoacyl-tRNA deacylase
MRILTQNIKSGAIVVDNQVVTKCNYGLAVFVGFTVSDEMTNVIAMSNKLLKLRVLPDEFGKTNKNIVDVNAMLLIIPNFTLYGDVSGGNRPSFTKACPADKAKQLYQIFIDTLKRQYANVLHGPFQAHMEINLINDGPFSLIVDDE